MTNKVKIAAVDGYDKTGEIRHFVKSAFELDPEITGFLANDDHKRVVVVKPNWIQEAHDCAVVQKSWDEIAGKVLQELQSMVEQDRADLAEGWKAE